MSRDRSRLRASWTRVSTPTRLAVLVIAVHLTVRAWLILPGEYWQDDFVFLRRARSSPLSWDLLLHAHNGHVIPMSFLLTWLAAHVHSYLPAALIMLALQALASLALWLFLRAVVGPTPAMVVALSVALFTPLMFSTVTWWAAGVMMLGLQLAMALAGYAHVQYQRTSRWRWLVVALLALLLGFAFWEKTVLIPAFLVLVSLLASGSARSTLRTVLRLWPAWLAYGLLTGAYLVAYAQVASVGGAKVRTVEGVVSLARHQMVDVFFRGLMGGPWHGLSSGAGWLPASAFGIALLLQVLVAFGVVAYRLAGPRSLVGWAAILLYLGLDVTLTARGRGLFFVFIQMDPRYVCDAIPLAAVCIAVMLTPRESRALRLPTWSVSWAAAFVVIVVVFNSSMVTASGMAGALHRNEVSTYIANARKSLAREPRLVLYDGFVPASIMIGAFPPNEKTVSSVLDAYGVDARYDLPSAQLRVLDDKGVARPVRLSFVQTGQIDPTDDCGVRLDSDHRQEVVELDRPVADGTWVLRLDYAADTDAVVDVVTTGSPQPVGLSAGLRSVFVTVRGGTSSVELILERGAGAVCASALTVGYPVPDVP
jgi:hypothetical protein